MASQILEEFHSFEIPDSKRFVLPSSEKVSEEKMLKIVIATKIDMSRRSANNKWFKKTRWTYLSMVAIVYISISIPDVKREN